MSVDHFGELNRVLMKLRVFGPSEENIVVACNGGELSSNLSSVYSGQLDRSTMLDRDIITREIQGRWID